MKQHPFDQLKNLVLIFAGNTLYALGVVMFILPGGMITGGTTGIALTVNHYFHVPISVFVFCFNLIMFIIGAVVLGKKFALTTLISTFYYPFILGVLENVPALGNFTNDVALSTIFGGLMIGSAIGIVIRAGASTGGMDIPPLVLNKKFGIPVSVLLYIFDSSILLMQMLFSNKDQILYGILLVMIYTIVLDKVLLLGTTQTQVKVVSKKYAEINQAIISELDRGSTLIYGETGYLHQEQPLVLSVVSNRELTRLNQIVMGIDPSAFMIISKVNEVKGRGFSSQKIYQKKES
ncbi:YitT family protein [Faecalicatena sp. Marseille-Q4148]|nr:YitT family protein [Faecalicatena sp. Marseille-Q4148]